MTATLRINEDTPKIIQITEEEHSLIILSDFHISGGKLPGSGKYRPTENFFYDEEFSRFIDHLIQTKGDLPWKMIINGDFLDVIRLTDYPATDAQFQQWEQLLKSVGIYKEISESDVSKHERKFGLKTHEYKSVWKLDFIAKAHPKVFSALSRFVGEGNSLVLIKGNHDIEFCWPGFQELFVQILLRGLQLKPAPAQTQAISNRISFVDEAYVIEDSIYIEHGHQYEDITYLKSNLLPWDKQQIFLPFGSFMNRYFLNKAEQIAPYLDNIKPPTAYLDAVIKSYPLKAFKQLLGTLFLARRVFKKKEYKWDAIKLILKALKYIIIPLAVLLLFALPLLIPAYKNFLLNIPLVGKYLADIKIGTLLSVLSVLNPIILALLKPKHDLVTKAVIKILNENSNIKLRYIILGHFHLCDRRQYESCTYLNCGSWTPKIVLEEKLRAAINFAFLRFDKIPAGGFLEPQILEWNDCAGRCDEVKLFEMTGSKKQEKIKNKYASI